VADVFQPSEPVVTVVSAAEVESAVAFGQPVETCVAIEAMSDMSAAFTAIVSPAETAVVEVSATLV
jgi:uncharacterized protein (UPF0218 family)